MSGLLTALSGWLGLLSLIWGVGLLVEISVLSEAWKNNEARWALPMLRFVAYGLLTVSAGGIVVRVSGLT